MTLLLRSVLSVMNCLCLQPPSHHGLHTCHKPPIVSHLTTRCQLLRRTNQPLYLVAASLPVRLNSTDSGGGAAAAATATAATTVSYNAIMFVHIYFGEIWAIMTKWLMR